MFLTPGILETELFAQVATSNELFVNTPLVLNKI